MGDKGKKARKVRSASVSASSKNEDVSKKVADDQKLMGRGCCEDEAATEPGSSEDNDGEDDDSGSGAGNESKRKTHQDQVDESAAPEPAATPEKRPKSMEPVSEQSDAEIGKDEAQDESAKGDEDR